MNDEDLKGWAVLRFLEHSKGGEAPSLARSIVENGKIYIKDAEGNILEVFDRSFACYCLAQVRSNDARRYIAWTSRRRVSRLTSETFLSRLNDVLPIDLNNTIALYAIVFGSLLAIGIVFGLKQKRYNEQQDLIERAKAEKYAKVCQFAITANSISGGGYMMNIMKGRLAVGTSSLAEYNDVQSWFIANCPEGW